MIRIAVILLLLANLGYYAFSQGMLRSLGMAPADPSEPERVQRQVRPEQLRILPAPEADAARRRPAAAEAAPAPAPLPAAPAPAPAVAEAPPPVVAEAKPEKPEKRECLQAGSFDAKQVEALRLQLAKLPEGSWKLDSSSTAGRWMVYLGKFSSPEALDKRRDELRTLDIPTDRARLASLEPGISLGRFSTEEAAERQQAMLARKGVSAKVVVERPELTSYTLRLPKADSATRKRVNSWHAMDGKELQGCS
ncbi:hypothetical protein GCM10027082_33550 [Comamonas humi]